MTPGDLIMLFVWNPSIAFCNTSKNKNALTPSLWWKRKNWSEGVHLCFAPLWYECVIWHQRGNLKTAVKIIAQGCQGGIMQFLKEDILNNKKPSKNIVYTTLQGIPPVQLDYFSSTTTHHDHDHVSSISEFSQTRWLCHVTKIQFSQFFLMSC